MQHQLGNLVVGRRRANLDAQRFRIDTARPRRNRRWRRRLNVTRKNFAVTGAKRKRMLRSAALGKLHNRGKFCPSSLASSDFSGLAIPATMAVIEVHIFGDDGERANRLRLRQIHTGSTLLSPAFGIGSLVVFSRSPSLSIAASGAARTRRHLRVQRFHRHIARRPAISDHRGIGIELRRRRSTRRRGEIVTNAQVLKRPVFDGG